MKANPEVTVRLIARGILDLFQPGRPRPTVRQDRDMPDTLRRASALLSRHCLEEGSEDVGASVHDLLIMATRQVGDWGLSCFAAPFTLAGVVLLDADLGLPTEECMEAGRDGAEVEISERLQHEKLRTAVVSIGRRRSTDAYSAIRGFVVRNPVVAIKKLREFEADWASVSQTIRGFYTTVSLGAIHPDGQARTCANCGALLWPHADQVRYPDGRCRVRACIEETPTPLAGLIIGDPASYATVEKSVLAYWVGPGLAEVRIYDRLRTAGLNVVLYPDEDAADVGTADFRLGIDVKTYGSPVMLARRLSAGIGGLARFKEKYVAVPDAKLRLAPDYLVDLQRHWTGKEPVVFATVSDVVSRILAAGKEPS